MTKETCNIILACKGSLHEPYSDLNIITNNSLERVKLYLSKEYENDLKLYTCEQMEKIMFQAMGDYLDTCDKPSEFIFYMSNLSGRCSMSMPEQIAETFKWVRVRKEYKYVNGFKQEFFDRRN